VSTYDNKVTFTAAPLVGAKAYCIRTAAPARKTGIGKLGKSLATKAALLRTEPRYQRGIRLRRSPGFRPRGRSESVNLNEAPLSGIY
jgi:hypothetical protein